MSALAGENYLMSWIYTLYGALYQLGELRLHIMAMQLLLQVYFIN